MISRHETARALTEPLSLDPFGFDPQSRSILPGLRPSGLAPRSRMVFHSAYLVAPANRLRFEGCFEGLMPGGAVTMFVHLHADGWASPRVVAKQRTTFSGIASAGGRFAIDCVAIPGERYALLARSSGVVTADATGLTLTVQASGHSAALDDPCWDLVDASDPAAPIYAPGAATLAAPVSQMCTAAQFEEPVYRDWAARMGESPYRHRKQWEFVFILRTLEVHGMLTPGNRGLGFGVGQEVLPAIFAAMGIDVVATDLPEEADDLALWHETGQHLGGTDQLRRADVCSEQALHTHVRYRPVDMRAIPDDLRLFDYTWSSCAFEHLGSIEAGLRFVERSLDCLRPGGLAVHTTELNVSSNSATLDGAATVLFRRRDIEILALRLLARGHQVFPIKLDRGDRPLDRFIDMPPFGGDAHIKIAYDDYTTTSFGFVLRKGTDVGSANMSHAEDIAMQSGPRAPVSD